MAKYATPATVVPGATPIMVGEGLMQRQAVDRKGRPLWNMPKPIDTHETLQVVERVIDGKLRKVKELVPFPVYRGIDASLMRYMKAQAKRARLKLEEKAAENV